SIVGCLGDEGYRDQAAWFPVRLLEPEFAPRRKRPEPRCAACRALRQERLQGPPRRAFVPTCFCASLTPVRSLVQGIFPSACPILLPFRRRSSITPRDRAPRSAP